MANTLTVKPAENVANIGKEISSEFLTRLQGLKLDATEQALVDRASHRLAAAAILSPGATPDVHERLKLDRDSAIAVMANLLAAKVVRAEQIIRQTAYDVIDKFIKIGIGLAATALA